MITNKDLGRKFTTEFAEKIFYIRFIRNSLKQFRIWMVQRYLNPAHVHIDIGCGDVSLLKASPCDIKIGLDKMHGDYIYDKLDFPDRFADFITMLAFIEHCDNPAFLIKESHRILKNEGCLIITTPFRSSERFLQLWNKNVSNEHKHYFDRVSMERMLNLYFTIKLYKKYFLNQLFICKKHDENSDIS